MSLLTDQQKKQYLDTEGVRCPYCKSPDIEGGHMSVEHCGASQTVTCTNCDAEWIDDYELVGITEISAVLSLKEKPQSI